MPQEREPLRSQACESKLAEQQGSLPRLMSAHEVADLVRRTRRTLLNWEKASLLIPIRIGRSKYYRLSDVERLINGRDEE